IGRAEYGREWITAGGGPEYAVRSYGLAVPPDTLRAMKEPVYHRLLETHVRLMPGVMGALARLLVCYPLAVATNSTAADMRVVVARLEIERFFQRIVTREHYERAK